MVVISDTSPLSNLIQLGLIGMLERLYSTVYIPTHVYKELCKVPGHRESIDSLHWIIIKDPKNLTLVSELKDILDNGEAEAITLALELKASLIIIDEISGRKIAEEKGLKITGILGILLLAKAKGIIPKVIPIIQKLHKNGFYLSEKVITLVLKKASET